jgi:hypothetical protein
MNTSRNKAIAFATLFLAVANCNLHAGSATWLASPGSNNWNVAANWTAGGPPNGASDTASFATSSRTSILLSPDTQVNAVTYSPGANAFTITIAAPSIFTISGVGITNSSGTAQNFINTSDASGNSAMTLFTNSATAGAGTTFTNNGAISSNAMSGAAVQFSNTASAGSASSRTTPVALPVCSAAM